MQRTRSDWSESICAGTIGMLGGSATFRPRAAERRGGGSPSRVEQIDANYRLRRRRGAKPQAANASNPSDAGSGTAVNPGAPLDVENGGDACAVAMLESMMK